MKYVIPTDYTEIFKDRVLIITGVGRSGTTILGKLIASMKPTFYLFEPAVMKYFIHPLRVTGYELRQSPPVLPSAHLLRAILFEDYFLPLICGRSVNLKANEWTFSENHWATSQFYDWQEVPSRRSEALQVIKELNPLYVIKTPEFQPLMEVAKEIFPGVRFIHIVRNGLEVVASAIERGWYTDQYCNNAMIDWLIEGKPNVPWYIDNPSKKAWKNWDQATRAACIWRCLTEMSMPGDHIGMWLKYDHLVENVKDNPHTEYYYDCIVTKLANEFDLQPTDITERHIQSIKDFTDDLKPIDINQIAEPEREKFSALMEKLGY